MNEWMVGVSRGSCTTQARVACSCSRHPTSTPSYVLEVTPAALCGLQKDKFFHFYHILLTPIPAHALSRGSCSRWIKNSSHDHTTHTPAKPHCEPSSISILGAPAPDKSQICQTIPPNICQASDSPRELVKIWIACPRSQNLGVVLGGTGSQVTLLGCGCSRVPLENLCPNLAPGAQCWSSCYLHQVLSTPFINHFPLL